MPICLVYNLSNDASPVIVYTKKGILFGEGLKSKQDFSAYVFKKPTGKIDLKEK